MLGQEDIRRIQLQVGELALQAVRIDVDGFLEATGSITQALTAGHDLDAISSAAAWSDTARLLKPFRDDAVTRLAQIREELAGDDLAPRDAACPSCGERRVDELVMNEDESVLCATCGRRYQLPGEDLVGQTVDGLPITGVSLADEVRCECHDRECECGGACSDRARFQWGGGDADDLQYLCHRCAVRMVERGSDPARGEEA